MNMITMFTSGAGLSWLGLLAVLTLGDLSLRGVGLVSFPGLPLRPLFLPSLAGESVRRCLWTACHPSIASDLGDCVLLVL